MEMYERNIHPIPINPRDGKVVKEFSVNIPPIKLPTSLNINKNVAAVVTTVAIITIVRNPYLYQIEVVKKVIPITVKPIIKSIHK